MRIIEAKRRIKRIDWGDGHKEKIKQPDLRQIPGDSVICPAPCNPQGDNPNKWDKHHEKKKEITKIFP